VRCGPLRSPHRPTHTSAGAEDGRKGVRVLTILDFGDQIGTTHANAWGAYPDPTYADMQDFAQAYIDGFYGAATSGQDLDPPIRAFR
jgi:hypothetical protein